MWLFADDTPMDLQLDRFGDMVSQDNQNRVVAGLLASQPLEEYLQPVDIVVD